MRRHFVGIKEIFEKEKIEYFSARTISLCDMRRPDFVERRGFDPEKIKTAVVFLIPYGVTGEEGNISLYARPRDYHGYCDGLFSRICPMLSEEYGGTFLGFADKSPVEETDLALRSGLCVRGDSYVVINEKYGSFVFIGEILTDVPASRLGFSGEASEIGECIHCGACRRACPMKNGRECLSAVTQKKGELTEDERDYIIENGSVWGCDICQTVCPMNKNAESTPIEYFREERIPRLSREIIDGMSNEEFASRAFSWRGKNTVIRNLSLFENGDK